MSNRVTLQFVGNSLTFYPEIATGLNVLGQASYIEQIQPWQFGQPYVQKLQFDDTITLLFHTQYSSPLPINPTDYPTLWICDEYKQEVSQVDNLAPYFKNLQFVSGNSYVDPETGTTTQLQSIMWSFLISDFFAAIESNEGIHYLRFDNIIAGEGAVSYFSEPWDLRIEHINTMQFKYTYNSNDWTKNVVVTNWWNDWPTRSEPFTVFFTTRCEAYINMFAPKVLNVGYQEQSYNQLQVKTMQTPSHVLKLGEVSLGIPYYMLMKITEVMLSDVVFINNFRYKLYNPSGSNNLIDLWKIKDNDTTPLVKAETTITWGSSAQGAMLSPTPAYLDGIFTDEFGDEFS